MRAKRFFNKLNSELNESLPKMSEELKNAPIPPCQTLEVVEEKQKTFDFTHFFTPKRLTAFATVFAIVFIAVFSTLTITGAFDRRSDSVVVKMEINPSIELLLNEDMEVEKVVSNNADGDVILAEEAFIDLIVGKNATEAIKIIVQK